MIYLWLQCKVIWFRWNIGCWFRIAPIANEIAPSIVALIVHGIVALWIVSCLAWIVRWLSLDWLSLNGLSLDWCSLWDELLRVWHSLHAGLNVLFLSDLLKFKRGKKLSRYKICWIEEDGEFPTAGSNPESPNQILLNL